MAWLGAIKCGESVLNPTHGQHDLDSTRLVYTADLSKGYCLRATCTHGHNESVRWALPNAIHESFCTWHVMAITIYYIMACTAPLAHIRHYVSIFKSAIACSTALQAHTTLLALSMPQNPSRQRKYLPTHFRGENYITGFRCLSPLVMRWWWLHALPLCSTRDSVSGLGHREIAWSVRK